MQLDDIDEGSIRAAAEIVQEKQGDRGLNYLVNNAAIIVCDHLVFQV